MYSLLSVFINETDLIGYGEHTEKAPVIRLNVRV